VVRGGKTPDLALADAEAHGLPIAILPGLLLGGIISVCDQLLETSTDSASTRRRRVTPRRPRPSLALARPTGTPAAPRSAIR
jgi:hypothetical protein